MTKEELFIGADVYDTRLKSRCVVAALMYDAACVKLPNGELEAVEYEKLAGVDIDFNLLAEKGYLLYEWPVFKEYTHFLAGEIILRLHNAGVSVFTPDMCEPDEVVFVTQCRFSHQLQKQLELLQNRE